MRMTTNLVLKEAMPHSEIEIIQVKGATQTILNIVALCNVINLFRKYSGW